MAKDSGAAPEKCADAACRDQGCEEHPRHDGGDHTYEQHHAPEEHVGGTKCRCPAYAHDDAACDFCSERMGDHTETMRWRCERGE